MDGSFEDNEKQWIKAIRSGDEKAFEKLFLRYYTPLCKFAWRYIRSTHIAEELVQEVFTNVWEIKKQLDPEGTLRAYLYQSVKNRALDHIKHQEVVRRHLSEMAQDTKETASPQRIPAGDTAFMKAARQAIEELPERARQVYKLHRKDGLTYSEIAQVMEISPKTVESQMSRALKILRNRLSGFLPILSVIGILGKIFR